MQRLDPPFSAGSPRKGETFMDKSNFVYNVLESKPHTNRDGSASWLFTFQGTCADCGKKFSFVQGPSRGSLARRCPTDAKGKGREKTYPYGGKPVAMADGRTEAELAGVIHKKFSDYVDAQELAGADAKGLEAAWGLFERFFLANWSLPDEPDLTA